MNAKPPQQIPVLTDIIGPDDTEALIAELQTRLAAATFEMTDDILRRAFVDLEAKLHEQIAGRLRRELPEIIDAMLREHLATDPID
jgi:hypothetical protein